MPDYTLHLGDAVEVLRALPDASVDACITDPPYAEIDRDYGRLTETEWHALMDAVVPEVRRVLKPTGSAVFILQPNSERVGRMRPWLWEFMAKWCREWNMVQDAWWWNICQPPTVHTHRERGLMRPSLKACVWLGPVSCYRSQDDVLWSEAEATKNDKREDRILRTYASGYTQRRGRIKEAAADRGGVTPFNVLPIGTGDARCQGHSASTPLRLCDWWVRYISPPGGVVLDPFIGSGTVGIAALKNGRDCIGIERDPGYHATAYKRLREAQAEAESKLFAVA